MPNTNFQTIHQMGQAINEVVRQATGRDAVQNIDMDHITVAQNQYYEEVTASGGMVSFTDRVGNMPLEKCMVQIEPVQDLHGYDGPWAGGAGKNLIPVITQSKTQNGVTFTINEDGTLTVNGTATDRAYVYVIPFNNFLPNGEYTCSVSGVPTTPNINNPFVNLSYSDDGTQYSGSYGVVAGNASRTYTVNHPYSAVLFDVPAGNVFNNNIIKIQIESGATATAWEPYSNICPITGWTGANIHVSPTTEAQDGTTYSITFPAEAGTVYGGSEEVIGGRLTSELANIVFDGSNSEGWSLITTYGSVTRFDKSIAGLKPASAGALLCNYLKKGVIGTANLECCNVHGTYSTLQIQIETSRLSDNTVAGLMAYFSSNPLQVVYELITHQTYQLTPTDIRTLPGQNNIWADTGDIEVKYKVLKELY